MSFPLSVQTVDAIADVISGGSANDQKPPIGVYRSGPEMERFMRGCNVDFRVSGSRLPSLVDCLLNINNGPFAEEQLTRVIQSCADPRDFISAPERHESVVKYLNEFLKFDGLVLQAHSKGMRLATLNNASLGTDELNNITNELDLDTVQRDLDRALTYLNSDPETAVTSACSTVESVCRTILVEIGKEFPAKKDIKSLYNAVREPLGLAPDKTDIHPIIADDVRKVLSGFATSIEGIGALRTHGSGAHGREKAYPRIDARIARLAVNSASTLSLFLIETWQRKYPNKPLHRENSKP